MGELAHGIQAPAISTDDEFTFDGAGRADQDVHALGRDDPAGEDHAATRRAAEIGPSGVAGIWTQRCEQGNHPATGQTVDRQVTIDGAGIGDDEIRLLERRQCLGRLQIPGRQAAEFARVRAPARSHLDEARGTMRSRALLARAEVVNARRAGGIAVHADHDRGACPQCVNELEIIELMDMDDTRGGQVSAQPRGRRGVRIAELWTMMNGDAGSWLAGVDPGGEHVYVRAVTRQQRRAGCHMSRHTAIPGPARRYQQNRVITSELAAATLSLVTTCHRICL